MIGASQQPDLADRPAVSRPAWRGWLGLGAVHLAMLIGGLLGIGYTSIAGPGSDVPGSGVFWIWMALVPAYFLACVWEGWGHAKASRLHRRLVVTQALHWLAFLIAMYVLLLPQVRGVLNDNAVGLALLTLLAMGTFIAGVHAWSMPVCVTGVLLALAVPGLAWVDANIVLLLACVLLLALLAAAALLVRRHFRATPMAGVLPSAATSD
jgi:hypothetical protein